MFEDVIMSIYQNELTVAINANRKSTEARYRISEIEKIERVHQYKSLFHRDCLYILIYFKNKRKPLKVRLAYNFLKIDDDGYELIIDTLSRFMSSILYDDTESRTVFLFDMKDEFGKYELKEISSDSYKNNIYNKEN